MSDYYKLREKNFHTKLKKLLNNFQPFIRTYFNNIEPTTTIRTRLSYAYDFMIFFRYILENNPKFSKSDTIKNVSLSDLASITVFDLEEYLNWLKTSSGDFSVSDVTRARRLASVRNLYHYLCSHGMIDSPDPSVHVKTPKYDTDKDPICLDTDDVIKLLDFIYKDAATFYKNRDKKLAYYNLVKERDYAIVSLLLGTGIRVSECEAISIDDIDFNKRNIHLLRKGEKLRKVHYGDEVEDALITYIDGSRNYFLPSDREEKALFLSTRKQRLSVRSYEQIINGYTMDALGIANRMSPHRLRSTFATTMLNNGTDIYTVSKALNHSSLNTAQRYAKMSEDRLKNAFEKISYKRHYDD